MEPLTPGEKLKYWFFLVVGFLLLLIGTCSHAGLFDGKYSQNQVFDVARSGCSTVGGNCYVYNFINPFIAPYTNWTNVTWAAGDYVKFYDTGAGSNNIGMKQYDSSNNLKGTISSSGYVQALGDGILYIGVPNVGGGTGYFISNSAGYSYGGSATFTVQTLNPTMTQLNNYNATTTPLASGQSAGPPPPNPTAIYNQGVSNNVWITNHYPTSNNSPAGENAAKAFDNNPNTKYLNFDKANAGVTVKLNQGRVVTGFTLTTANDFSGRDPTSYKLYGSNNGTTWTLISEGSLSLSETRFWTSPTITVANVNAYVYYYIFFPTTKAGVGCGLNCDSMQIAEITFYYDSNNTTTSSDTGGGSVANPSDLCCGGVATPFAKDTAFNNRVTAYSSRPLLDTKVKITQIGNSNSATINQTGTKNNYSEISVTGNYNTTNTTQSSTNITGTNYIELTVSGNNNTANLTQQSAGGSKSIMANMNNNSNTLTINQSGSGSHYAEINLAGSNKSVNLTQSGSANHMANISLSGGTTSLTATQSGSTQQYYSIIHNCATASCAAITVNQTQ